LRVKIKLERVLINRINQKEYLLKFKSVINGKAHFLRSRLYVRTS